MAILSSPKARRRNTPQGEATQQLITFRLHQEWFALPLLAVQKVIPLGTVYGDPKRTGISFTVYQDREIAVVDVAQRIFGETRTSEVDSGSPIQRYLLILQSQTGELVGLPIDSQPLIKKVPRSSIVPLPETYLAQGNIRCVSSTMIPANDQPPLFLLSPEQLNQPQQILPSRH